MPAPQEQHEQLLDVLGVCLEVEGPPATRVQGVLDEVISRGLLETHAIAATCNTWDPEQGMMRRMHFAEAIAPNAEPAPREILNDESFRQIFFHSKKELNQELPRHEKGPFHGTFRDVAAALNVDPAAYAPFFEPKGINDFYLVVRLAKNMRLTSISTIEMKHGPELSDESKTLLDVLSKVLTESIASISPETGDSGPDAKLSRAQTTVLLHALAGHTEKQIARRLSRSHHTVPIASGKSFTRS